MAVWPWLLGGLQLPCLRAGGVGCRTAWLWRSAVGVIAGFPVGVLAGAIPGVPLFVVGANLEYEARGGSVGVALVVAAFIVTAGVAGKVMGFILGRQQWPAFTDLPPGGESVWTRASGWAWAAYGAAQLGAFAWYLLFTITSDPTIGAVLALLAPAALPGLITGRALKRIVEAPRDTLAVESAPAEG